MILANPLQWPPAYTCLVANWGLSLAGCCSLIDLEETDGAGANTAPHPGRQQLAQYEDE